METEILNQTPTQESKSPQLKREKSIVKTIKTQIIKSAEKHVPIRPTSQNASSLNKHHKQEGKKQKKKKKSHISRKEEQGIQDREQEID